jgi:hypothetical protein
MWFKTGAFLFGVSTSLLMFSGIAQADWGFEQVRLTEIGPPDIVTSGGGTASGSAGLTAYPPPVSKLAFNCTANTGASASPGPQRNTAFGGAFVQARMKFTWSGTGTPTSMQLKKRLTWSISPAAPGSTLVSPYVLAAFDGVPVTTISSASTPPWVNGFMLSSGTTEFIYSVSSSSISGYSGGGYSGRSSSALYEWDMSYWYP